MSDDGSTNHARKALGASISLLVVATAVILMFGASWPALILIAAFALGLAGYQQAALQDTWRNRREPDRGELTCPECGSVQTERVERFDDQGRTYQQPHCFACGADFEEDETD